MKLILSILFLSAQIQAFSCGYSVIDFKDSIPTIGLEGFILLTESKDEPTECRYSEITHNRDTTLVDTKEDFKCGNTQVEFEIVKYDSVNVYAKRNQQYYIFNRSISSFIKSECETMRTVFTTIMVGVLLTPVIILGYILW